MMDLIGGKWLNNNTILSYGQNGNVIKAKREIGKSYGALIQAHARRRRKHEGTVWLRFTGEDAEGLASAFGDGKWRAVWDALGMTPGQFKRKGGRILYREKEGAPWLPLIRFVGLSQWSNLRDADDPQETFLFFDEYIVPESKLRMYRGGRPAEDFIDLWVSLRRGKDRMPFLLCGNPELGQDWFLPSLISGADKETAEVVRLYETRDDVRDKCRDSEGRFALDKIAVLWTTNPKGHSAGGSGSGLARRLPEGLERHRSGRENLYLQCDLGAGLISIWLTSYGMLVDTYRAPRESVFKLFPDGDRTTRILSRNMSRWLGLLRSYWLGGRVYYANVEAFDRFKQTYAKLGLR